MEDILSVRGFSILQRFDGIMEFSLFQQRLLLSE